MKWTSQSDLICSSEIVQMSGWQSHTDPCASRLPVSTAVKGHHHAACAELRLIKRISTLLVAKHHQLLGLLL